MQLVGLSKKLDVWIKPIDQNIAINMFFTKEDLYTHCI